MIRTLALALCLLVPSLASAHTVAVLYFADGGNAELAPLKVGLGQMLIADLHGTPDVQVVERARLQEILEELQLGHGGVTDTTSAAQIGHLLGAEWLVLGNYFSLSGTLQINANLVDVQTGVILEATEVRGRTRDFFELEEQLGASVRELVEHRAELTPDPEFTEPAETVRTRGPEPEPEAAPVTPNVRSGDALADAGEGAPDELGAALAFSEGLIALDQQDAARARESFERALEQAPTMDEARAELSALSL